MIKLYPYTDQVDKGGYYIMQPWWVNFINSDPDYKIGTFRLLLKEWNGIMPEDFLLMRDNECYILFENDHDANFFLLRWG